MAVRVAIVTESFLPRVNGVTNSVCRVVEHLASRGHEALVIAPGPGPSEYAGQPVELMPGFALPGYQSFVLGMPTARQLEKRLRAFRPDIVHLASPIVLGAAGAHAARKLDVPSVAVFQTDVAGFARRYGFRGTDRIIWSWMRRVHSQAALNLVPSSATFKQLQERGFPRLAMWRRGVDAVRFDPKHRGEEWRRGIAPNGELLVGYVGRVSGDKRVDMLAGLSGIPGVKVVVVGEGPAEARLRSLMPDAAFPGFLDGHELARAFAGLDVFVHTGADETFCQSIQEAMASGVPVVAPAAGGPLDLVRPGETGLLYAPESPEEMRAAVERLIGDADLRRSWGEAARAIVEHRSWSSVGDELLRHYRSVVSGGAPADPSITLPLPANLGTPRPAGLGTAHGATDGASSDGKPEAAAA